MKRKGVIIGAVLLVVVAVLFFLLGQSLVTFSVVSKSEKRFCPPSAANPLVYDENRKLIKTGDLEFECESLSETRKQIEQAVKAQGGFIQDEELSRYEKRAREDLIIRVPSENFDTLVSEISKGAVRMERRSIEIEDVTEQYVDTETRLAVKRQLETRYRELLSKAEDVADIVAIEEQIAKLREDIESAEVQLKKLDDRVALSTLDVGYYINIRKTPQFKNHFQNGIDNGWKNLVWFFVGLVNIWPFILIILMLIGGFKIYRKNK